MPSHISSYYFVFAARHVISCPLILPHIPLCYLRLRSLMSSRSLSYSLEYRGCTTCARGGAHVISHTEYCNTTATFLEWICATLSLVAERPPRKGQTMELTREYLDGEVAKLTALADSVKSKAGSAAKRQQEATDQAMGVDVTFSAEDTLPTLATVGALLLDPAAEGKQYLPINLGELATAVQALDEWAAQVANEAVTAILKAQGDDSTLDTMRAQYAKQKEVVEALLVVFAATTDIDVSDITLPTLRAARATSTPRRQGTKRGHFYRVIDGEKRYQSDNQDTQSSVAWYFGAVITEQTGKGSTNNGKGVPVNELEAYLRKHVTDSPLGKPWEVEREGVVFGYEIASASDEEE